MNATRRAAAMHALDTPPDSSIYKGLSVVQAAQWQIDLVEAAEATGRTEYLHAHLVCLYTYSDLHHVVKDMMQAAGIREGDFW